MPNIDTIEDIFWKNLWVEERIFYKNILSILATILKYWERSHLQLSGYFQQSDELESVQSVGAEQSLHKKSGAKYVDI